VFPVSGPPHPAAGVPHRPEPDRGRCALPRLRAGGSGTLQQPPRIERTLPAARSDPRAHYPPV